MKKYYDLGICDSMIHSSFVTGKQVLRVMTKDSCNNNEDNVTHGDKVFHVLCKKLKKNIDCLNIDITNANYFDILSALCYIRDNILCKVISISAGIDCCDVEYRRALHSVCNELTYLGVVIVSGFSNMGRIAYPAAFDCVVGVDMSLLCKNVNDFEVVQSNIVNIRGTCSAQTLVINDTRFVCAGTSFVVPLVVAIILNNELNDLKKVFNYFESISQRIIKCDEEQVEDNFLFPISKAIVFPLNKEIKNLILNKDLIEFDIANIYDHKSRIIQSIIKVNNYEKINWNDNFDTIILGHLKELSAVLKIDLLAFFIDNICSYQKNVVFFDNINNEIKERLNLAGVQYFCASENIVKDYKTRFGKLRYLSVPIVGVFGTSPKQGKFTLQLKLYREFLRLGYDVGMVGSEPVSKLLGADETVICGYGSTIMNNYDLAFDVNEKLFKLEEKGKDIVFISSQSQTVPAGFGNLAMYPMYQESILLGSLPDAIILCVNYYDDLRYIERTINYIESLVDSKVLAISMFVFENINGELRRVDNFIIQKQKETIEKKLNVKVYCCDESILDLINKIIDFLQYEEKDVSLS